MLSPQHCLTLGASDPVHLRPLSAVLRVELKAIKVIDEMIITTIRWVVHQEVASPQQLVAAWAKLSKGAHFLAGCAQKLVRQDVLIVDVLPVLPVTKYLIQELVPMQEQSIMPRIYPIGALVANASIVLATGTEFRNAREPRQHRTLSPRVSRKPIVDSIKHTPPKVVPKHGHQ